MSAVPQVTRLRHELQRRRAQVARVELLAPRMLRVVLRGDELEGFTSSGFDDHIKLFFDGVNGSQEMRDFTPRRFDARTGELWIEFFLHADGPAAEWAARALAGLSLDVGGPKGSSVVSAEGIDAHLLIGDETALPAIARRLEELPFGARARVFVEVDDTEEWRTFPMPSGRTVVWVPRAQNPEAPAASLISTLQAVDLPPRSFCWVAMETQAARAVRRFLTERGVDRHWIKAAGYWQRARCGTHERIADDE